MFIIGEVKEINENGMLINSKEHFDADGYDYVPFREGGIIINYGNNLTKMAKATCCDMRTFMAEFKPTDYVRLKIQIKKIIKKTDTPFGKTERKEMKLVMYSISKI